MPRLLILLATILYSITSFADQPIQQLQTLLKNTASISANFTQIVTGQNRLTTNGKYTGTLQIQRPGKFRWQVNKPERQTIVADGKNLWIYDEELEQVSVQPQKDQIGQAPAMLLTGDVDVIAEQYQVQEVTSGGIQWFILKPKKSDGMLKEIQLGFKNKLVHGMDILDVMDTTTHLEFTKVKINELLNDTLFEFKPPKNVDVIGTAV